MARAVDIPMPGYREPTSHSKAKDMALGFRYGNGFAAGIPFADEKTNFEFVIEQTGGSKDRTFGVHRFALTAGTFDFRSADDDRGCAAVIANGHMLIVGKQRAIRTK